MVFGNPNKFAILMEYMSCWTMKGSYRNGLFHFIVDGQMFPTSTVVSTLGGDILLLERGNPLINTPENKELFFMNKVEVYTQIMNNMLPEKLNPDFETPDDFEDDWRYNAATNNLTENSSYAFAIGYDEQIRILAAKTSFLSGNPDDGYEWKDYDNLEVAEVILPKIEVQQIVSAVIAQYHLTKDLS